MNPQINLHLGAGTKILSNYINHDIAPLDGIDVVHDLNIYPWPWADNSIDSILAIDLIEHLDNFLSVMAEIHRILKPGGILTLKVPYWNSVYAHADPTHKRGFHEFTFHFFDPDSHWCKQRPYYTNTRFKIIEEHFVILPFAPYMKIPFLGFISIRNSFAKRMFGFFGNLFSNIILDLHYKLVKIDS